ncbi:MAG: class I SAM-dependent methyltransferase [Anaerolineae bacterium]
MTRLRRKLARAHHPNVRPLLGDACHIPPTSEIVDVAFAYSVLEEIPDLAAAVLEIARLLQPGGKVAVAQFMFDFSPAIEEE